VPDVPYGITLATLFTGRTGMRLQGLGAPGKDALLLGVFLTANEWANMIGLYELSPAKLARCFPSVKGKALEKAFGLLNQEQFAHYDEPTEFVWVREMARIRLNINAGEKVSNPRRLVAAQNLYQRSPMNPFLGPFFDRYHVELGLKHRRGDHLKVAEPVGDLFAKPFAEPVTKPVAEPFAERSSGTSTYRDQKAVPGTSTQGSANQRSGEQGSERTAAGPQRRQEPEVDPDPEGHYAVITAVVTKDILPLRLEDHLLVKAVQDRCDELHIAHSPAVIRKAVDSALFRYYRSVRLENDLPADPRGMFHDHEPPRTTH
jgi:hypothetical protein